MAQADQQIGHESLDAMLSIAALLETPRLARLYADVFQHEPTTVDALHDRLDMARSTISHDLSQLVNQGLLATTETTPREYTARPVSLTVETETDNYTVTPALIAAIARQDEHPEINEYLNRHGIAGLAHALDYAVQYISGEMNARIMSRRHEMTVVETETLLQTLREILITFDAEAGEIDAEFSWL